MTNNTKPNQINYNLSLFAKGRLRGIYPGK